MTEVYTVLSRGTDQESVTIDDNAVDNIRCDCAKKEVTEKNLLLGLRDANLGALKKNAEEPVRLAGYSGRAAQFSARPMRVDTLETNNPGSARSITSSGQLSSGT